LALDELTTGCPGNADSGLPLSAGGEHWEHLIPLNHDVFSYLLDDFDTYRSVSIPVGHPMLDAPLTGGVLLIKEGFNYGVNVCVYEKLRSNLATA